MRRPRRMFRAVTLILALTAFPVVGAVDTGLREQRYLGQLAREFLDTLSEKEKAAFLRASKDDLPLFHFGAGSKVRELYFGPRGEGRALLCQNKDPCDIDAESMRIVERTWEIIHGAA